MTTSLLSTIFYNNYKIKKDYLDILLRIDNKSAAEANRAVIKNDRLLGSCGALGDWEGHSGDAILDRLNDAGLIGLAVADFSLARERKRGGRRRDPGEFMRRERAAIERGMIVALGDDDDVAGRIFADHKPRLSWAADGEAAPLADCVVSDAIMAADDFAFGRFKISRRDGDIVAQKLFKVALADEADAGAIFFFRGRELMRAG